MEKRLNFLGAKIDLSLGTFEPRMETEYWVGKAIKEIKKRSGNKKIYCLDIFAGSGCIGLAILKNIKNSSVDFVDIDQKAIKQIKINLKINNIPEERYKIYRSNLFKELTGKKYDYILANPPYVALKRIKEVQKSVLDSEPRIALFAGQDGLLYIRKFLKQAKKYLKKEGKIYLEFDPLQKEEISKILKKFHYSKCRFFKDQYDKWRYLMLL